MMKVEWKDLGVVKRRSIVFEAAVFRNSERYGINGKKGFDELK